MRSDKERLTGKGAPSFWSQRIHKQGSHFLQPGRKSSKRRAYTGKEKGNKTEKGMKKWCIKGQQGRSSTNKSEEEEKEKELMETSQMRRT